MNLENPESTHSFDEEDSNLSSAKIEGECRPRTIEWYGYGDI